MASDAEIGQLMNMISVVIADDHAVVRAGIRAVLSAHGDITIAGEAENGRSALMLVEKHKPNVLITDLTMPELAGVEAIGRVRTVSPLTRVLVLSMHAGSEFVRPALRAGALGYVVKGAGLDDLVLATRTVAAGEKFLGAQAEMAVGDEHGDDLPTDDLDRLTQREREVLQLVAEGCTNRVIGERLGCASKTVDVHRTNLMKKLDLHSTSALTLFAVRRGLISSS